MANIKCLEILLPSFDEKMFLTDILLAPTHGNAQLELRIFLFNSTWKYVLEAYYVSSWFLVICWWLLAIRNTQSIGAWWRERMTDYEVIIWQWFSKCGSPTGKISTTWEFMRVATRISESEAMGAVSAISFHRPSKWLWYMLKFENHAST